jgi:hypothetical protein
MYMEELLALFEAIMLCIQVEGVDGICIIVK